MANVWVVRAESGMYTDHFLDGGYAAIGWDEIGDLADLSGKGELTQRYCLAHPQHSDGTVRANVGQIVRFRFEINAGDWVITPSATPGILHHGKVLQDAYHYVSASQDGCPYGNRLKVAWANEPTQRSAFSIPFQNNIRSALTVFRVSHTEEFLQAIQSAPVQPTPTWSFYEAVIDRILLLSAQDFEQLVKHLMAAIGFEDAHVTGGPGDGGVDVVGVLNASSVTRVQVHVQVKRYKQGNLVKLSQVRELRQAIPFGEQGAFFTTSYFQHGTSSIAEEAGFPRIGLINGRNLVHLLVQHWGSIPEEFQETFGLRVGLVPMPI